MSSIEHLPYSERPPTRPVAAAIIELAQKPRAVRPEPVNVEPMPNEYVKPQAHILTHHMVFPIKPEMEFAEWNIAFGD